MKYGFRLEKNLCLMLCLFLVDKICAQKFSRQQTDDINCPDGTICKEISRCRRTLLKSLRGPPEKCGLTFTRKQRICCPTKYQFPPAAPTPQPTLVTGKKPPTDCGEVNGLQGFIRGKKPAKQGAWPWMVAIAMRKRNGRYDHICTGAMITRRHVLSAAHCFRRKDPTLYVARIGNVNYKLSYEYVVRKIDVADTYRRGMFYGDIAVLTLKQNVDIQPVCLPESTEYVDLTGKGTTVAGWGAIDPHNNSASVVLYELPAIPVVSYKKCHSDFSSALLTFRRDFPLGITDEFYCGGTSSKDTCIDDGGGPLMYQQRDRWYIVGVASFGVNGCGKSNLPDGYARVSKYLNWIREKISN